MDEKPRSQKHEEARESLPEELCAVFDELVEDYRFSTVCRFGQGYIAYAVLADLIRAGWRHAATPITDP